MSVDLSLFSAPNGSDAFGLNNTACAGAAKVANTFLMLLLTDSGAVPADPTRGTSFLAQIQSGRARRDDEVAILFNLAAASIRRYLSPLEQRTPDTEAFGKAELVSWASSSDTLTLHIRITTRAGEVVSRIAPVDYI